MQTGADDYLIKPFSARELLARVDAWEWEPASDRVAASETASDVYGLLAGDTLQSSAQAFALVHPEDVERHRAIVQGATQRGEGFRSEFRIIRPRDGQVAWLEERGSARRDPDTEALRLTGLVIDITERKRAELNAALLADINAGFAQVSGFGCLLGWAHGAYAL
jgi:PAS domain S-box-containing protein